MPARTSRRRPRLSATGSPPLDLALQGGGSHGAFTWGVLDRLLQDESLPIAAVSGTSAGAMNAAVLASGWAQGGRAGARRALAAFWHDIGGQRGCFGSHHAPSAPPGDLAQFNLELHPAFQWWSNVLRFFTPQQLNPLGLDPLRDIVRRHVDPHALAESPLAVFVTATSVRSGQPRVFDNRELGDLDIDALLASACLPTLFRPVVIDGEAWWDGGYSGNPSLWPLIYGTESMDLLLVRITPRRRERLPGNAEEIADRAGEIGFNAGLLAELRAIAFVQRLVEEGRLDPREYKNLRLHMVADDDSLAQLQPSSKLNTAPEFLQRLHGLGVAAAERWLAAGRAQVGVASSVDIRAEFLDAPPSPRRAVRATAKP